MKKTIAVTAMVLLLTLAAAAKDESLTVELKNAQGESIGTATLTAALEVFRTGHAAWHGGRDVEIKLNLHGLPPGEHGIHIHRDPVCEAPGFMSAAGHINPQGKKHGLKNHEGPHAGDLPNIKADANGNVKQTIKAEYASMEQLIAGRALVIHAQADDMMTDPTGNSGAGLRAE